MPNVYSYKTCINCGNKERRNGKKYCGNKCQNDYQYKEKIRKWLAGEISGQRGKTATAYWIKRYMIETKGHQCECCKNTTWMEKPIPLDLDHIDGDFLNNKIGNLRLLCYNCHGQTSTFKGANKVGRPRSKYYRGI